MLAEFKPQVLKTKTRTLLIEKPMVMGILNTTSDSFYDGGKYHTIENALKHCSEMLENGADIIDIGGQSTRPGAAMVSADFEQSITAPVIEAIMKHFPQTIISIDTFRASVAKAALDAGAAMVNDVSAGDDDPEMLTTVAKFDVPYIAMHKKGMPADMQNDPKYQDVTLEVHNYFKAKLIETQSAGISQTIIDPGFGFGKTMTHNYHLLSQLQSFQSFNLPILVGVSRKSMIWKLLSVDPKNALNGTSSVNTIALLNGAHILRVHDVKEAVECVKVVSMLRKSL
ncbi:MAG TPA: dihydropteroate synthase [Bacteroidia bacterium]